MPIGHPADTVVAIADVVRQSEPRCGTTRVVAIDGRSGSGKTTLAAQLATALDAPVVHMDDLYPGWDGLAASVSLLTHDLLAPLSRGEPGAYRQWNWTTDSPAGSVSVLPSPVLIVEGAGSSVGEAGRYAAVRVWVDASPEVRRERGLARDGDAYGPHWERWARQEEAVFAANGTAERADVRLDTTVAG